MERSAARAVVCVGVLAIAAHVLRGGADNAVYDGIGIVSSLITFAAVYRYRPANRVVWLLLAACASLFAAGDVAYTFETVAFPNVADAFYLAGYVAWIAAVLGLVRRERFSRDLGMHIDAVVVVGAIGLALWTVFVDEQLAGASILANAVSLAYPVGDLVLLALLVRVLFEPGRRTAAFWWILAAVAVMPLADAAYVVPLVDEQTYGIWMDVLWLFSYVAIAAGALDPSRGAMTKPGSTSDEGTVTIRRFYVLGGAIATVPAAALVSQLWHGYVDTTVVCVASLAIVGVVTFRIVLILRQLFETRDRLVESERRFRMVFERSPIGISVGRHGLMSETNPALHRMLGYRRDEFAQLHYRDVTHPDDRLLGVQVELDEAARDSFTVDKRYVTKDGETVFAHVHVALDGPDGLGVSLIEDVTHRRALEEQLRQSQKMEAVGQLAGGIAHDFNNLMTAVLGYSDLILAKLEPGNTVGERVEAIRDAAVRASELTQQLLAFSRRQMLQTIEVDLRDVLARMDTLLRRLIGEQIELVTTFGAEPVVVRADPVQIEQVVMNLAVNARDAMPDGGTLAIAAFGDGTDAILSVADTGTGMDESTQGRIFEPFFTTKPVGAGTGLGLSTVDGIVGQSGGAIEVETEPGRGTVFVIRLPLHRPAGVLPSPEAAATLVD